MPLERVLIVDDEPLIGRFLKEALQRLGIETELAEGGKRGAALLREGQFDLLLTDMRMPDLSGLELLRIAKEHAPETLVIVMTAFGTIESAVEAMHLGAYHYLLKPFTADTLQALLQKAQEHLSLVRENTFLRQEVLSRCGPSKIIAESPMMRRILEEVKRVARSSASVFIQGESGTGKEVVAGAIHQFSLRAARPYIRVNCAAVPDTLIESEFFGHEKGAFTGAAGKKIGRFELAHQGTLLLDEVTEIPLHLQPKLLRVIQEQELERIGGTKPISIDVRLIATSNRNLKEALSEKILREDLYYRLNVVPIHLPPLRERREDILPLARHFLSHFCQENRKKPKQFTDEAESKLIEYAWPGNIRELANAIERAVVLDFAPLIESAHLNLS